MTKMSDQPNVVLGIDLGTTNSCVAYASSSSEFVVVPLGKSNTVESIVYLGADIDRERVYVGDPADLQAIVKGRLDRLIQKPKGRLGNPEAARDQFRSEYARCMESSTDHLDPEDVVSYILRYLKTCAESHIKRNQARSIILGHGISRAVLGIPAGAGNGFRIGLKRAAELAGFKHTHLVPEPVAGARDFLAVSGTTLQPGELLLAIDIGAGTTDVTLIEQTEDGKLNVRLSDGDMALGGDRIDWELLILVEKKSGSETIPRTRHNLMRIRAFKEKVNEITDSADAHKYREVLYFKDAAEKDVAISLSGADILAACRHVADRICSLVEEFLADDAKLSHGANLITRVLLLGGAAKMQATKNMVERLAAGPAGNRFRLDTGAQRADQYGSWDPRVAVARGLARIGADWASGDLDDRDFIYQPRLARPVGLAVLNDEITPKECLDHVLYNSVHLPKHYQGPGRSSAKFYTMSERHFLMPHDNVKLMFLMGGQMYVSRDAPQDVVARFFNECECIGEANFELVPRRLGKYVHIRVQYSIDTDGVVNVHVRDWGFTDLEDPANRRSADTEDRRIELRFAALTNDDCAKKRVRNDRLAVVGPD